MYPHTTGVFVQMHTHIPVCVFAHGYLGRRCKHTVSKAIIDHEIYDCLVI